MELVIAALSLAVAVPIHAAPPAPAPAAVATPAPTAEQLKLAKSVVDAILPAGSYSRWSRT